MSMSRSLAPTSDEVTQTGVRYARPRFEDTYSKYLEALPDLSPINWDLFYADPVYAQEYMMYMNAALLEFRKNKSSKLKYYAVTFTDGEEADPNVLLKRAESCLSLKGVKSLKGVVELHKSGLPHLHFTIISTEYINKKQLLRKNKNKRMDIQKLWNEKGWDTYMEKTQDDPELLNYLKKYDLEKSVFEYKNA